MSKEKFNFAEAYYRYKKIRRTEERITEIYSTDKIKSPVHLSIGQESIAVGCSMASSKKDIIFSNYRGHAHFIAHGGDYKAFWSELYGKSNGLSSGKAGSMHLGDLNINFMFTSAIVASSIPNAVGYALAQKMKNFSHVVLCYHGDGAMDEGVFWESINFASLKQLPILFICENNEYAIYSHLKKRMYKSNIIERVNSFGLEAKKIKNDTFTIFKETKKILNKIRINSRPYFIEISTSRLKDHVGIKNSPNIKKNDSRLSEDKELVSLRSKVKDFKRIDKTIESEIDEAIEYAEKSKYPKQNEVMNNVFSNL